MVWADNFVPARTHDGLPLWLLVVVDEFTREYLSIDVARHLNSDYVLERLAWRMATRCVSGQVAATTVLSLRWSCCGSGSAR